MKSAEDVQNLMKSHKAGDEVICQIIRKGIKQTLKAELGENPMPGHRIPKMHGPGNFSMPDTDFRMQDFEQNMEKMNDDLENMEKEIQIKVIKEEGASEI